MMRVTGFDLLGADLFDINTKGAGHGRLAENLFAALFGQGHRNRPAAFEASGNACFFLKVAVEFLRILRQPLPALFPLGAGI